MTVNPEDDDNNKVSPWGVQLKKTPKGNPGAGAGGAAAKSKNGKEAPLRRSNTAEKAEEKINQTRQSLRKQGDTSPTTRNKKDAPLRRSNTAEMAEAKINQTKRSLRKAPRGRNPVPNTRDGLKRATTTEKAESRFQKTRQSLRKAPARTKKTFERGSNPGQYARPGSRGWKLRSTGTPLLGVVLKKNQFHHLATIQENEEYMDLDLMKAPKKESSSSSLLNAPRSKKEGDGLDQSSHTGSGHNPMDKFGVRLKPNRRRHKHNNKAKTDPSTLDLPILNTYQIDLNPTQKGSEGKDKSFLEVKLRPVRRTPKSPPPKPQEEEEQQVDSHGIKLKPVQRSLSDDEKPMVEFQLRHVVAPADGGPNVTASETLFQVPLLQPIPTTEKEREEQNWGKRTNTIEGLQDLLQIGIHNLKSPVLGEDGTTTQSLQIQARQVDPHTQQTHLLKHVIDVNLKHNLADQEEKENSTVPSWQMQVDLKKADEEENNGNNGEDKKLSLGKALLDFEQPHPKDCITLKPVTRPTRCDSDDDSDDDDEDSFGGDDDDDDDDSFGGADLEEDDEEELVKAKDDDTKKTVDLNSSLLDIDYSEHTTALEEEDDSEYEDEEFEDDDDSFGEEEVTDDEEYTDEEVEEYTDEEVEEYTDEEVEDGEGGKKKKKKKKKGGSKKKKKKKKKDKDKDAKKLRKKGSEGDDSFEEEEVEEEDSFGEEEVVSDDEYTDEEVEEEYTDEEIEEEYTDEEVEEDGTKKKKTRKKVVRRRRRRKKKKEQEQKEQEDANEIHKKRSDEYKEYEEEEKARALNKLEQQQKRLSQKRAEEADLKKKEEPAELSATKKKDLVMWYNRMRCPNKKQMKERVKKLPQPCDITPEDVELLPWLPGGMFMNLKILNQMILDDWQGANPDSDEKKQ